MMSGRKSETECEFEDVDSNRKRERHRLSQKSVESKIPGCSKVHR